VVVVREYSLFAADVVVAVVGDVAAWLLLL
jgi:hypothetical protein